MSKGSKLAKYVLDKTLRRQSIRESIRDLVMGDVGQILPASKPESLALEEIFNLIQKLILSTPSEENAYIVELIGIFRSGIVTKIEKDPYGERDQAKKTLIEISEIIVRRIDF